MTAKEYLSQIRKFDKLYENTMAEAQRWQEIADNTSVNMSGERVQSSGSHDTMANALCKCMDLKLEAEHYKQQREGIISTIKQLDAVHYDVLYKVYAQGIQLKEIATLYHKRREWASIMHREALEQLEIILNRGKNEICTNINSAKMV